MSRVGAVASSFLLLSLCDVLPGPPPRLTYLRSCALPDESACTDYFVPAGLRAKDARRAADSASDCEHPGKISKDRCRPADVHCDQKHPYIENLHLRKHFGGFVANDPDRLYRLWQEECARGNMSVRGAAGQHVEYAFPVRPTVRTSAQDWSESMKEKMPTHQDDEFTKRSKRRALLEANADRPMLFVVSHDDLFPARPGHFRDDEDYAPKERKFLGEYDFKRQAFPVSIERLCLNIEIEKVTSDSFEELGKTGSCYTYIVHEICFDDPQDIRMEGSPFVRIPEAIAARVRKEPSSAVFGLVGHYGPASPKSSARLVEGIGPHPRWAVGRV